jgi:UrcA family protein
LKRLFVAACVAARLAMPNAHLRAHQRADTRSPQPSSGGDSAPFKESIMLDLLAFAALAAATRATVSADIRQQSRVVRYGDLNLTTVAGREELDRRVHKAATRVCWELAYEKWPHTRAEYDCRLKAIADAGIQVAAVVARHGGAPDPDQRILIAKK